MTELTDDEVLEILPEKWRATWERGGGNCKCSICKALRDLAAALKRVRELETWITACAGCEHFCRAGKQCNYPDKCEPIVKAYEEMRKEPSHE